MITSNLLFLMEERGLTIAKVCTATGISRNTLSSFTNNTANGIRYDTLNKLCTFFDITPSELLLYSPYDYEIIITPIKPPDDPGEKRMIKGTLIIDNSISPVKYDISSVNIPLIGELELIDGTSISAFLSWETLEQEKEKADFESACFSNMIQDFQPAELVKFRSDIMNEVLKSSFNDNQQNLKIKQFSFDFMNEIFSYKRKNPIPTDYNSFYLQLFEEIEECQENIANAIKQVQRLIKKEREDKITWKVLTQSTAEDPDPTENQPNE